MPLQPSPRNRQIWMLSPYDVDLCTGQGQRSHLILAGLMRVMPAAPVGRLHTAHRMQALTWRLLQKYRIRHVQLVPSWLARQVVRLYMVRWIAGELRARQPADGSWMLIRYFDSGFELLLLPLLCWYRMHVLLDLDDNPVELRLRQSGGLHGRWWLLAMAGLALKTMVINLRLGLYRLLLGRRLVLVSPSHDNKGIAFAALSGSVLPNVPLVVPPCPLPPVSGPVLGFIGTLGYLPNYHGITWFAENCLPRLREIWPDIVLKVAGAGWMNLPLPMRDRLEACDGVDVIGEVADVCAFYEQVALTVCPLRLGAGTNIKVLESLAWGRRVVGTPKAFHGMQLAELHGLAAHQATTRDEFVLAIEACLGLPADRQAEIASAAHDFMIAHYSTHALHEALAKLLKPS